MPCCAGVIVRACFTLFPLPLVHERATTALVRGGGAGVAGGRLADRWAICLTTGILPRRATFTLAPMPLFRDCPFDAACCSDWYSVDCVELVSAVMGGGGVLPTRYRCKRCLIVEHGSLLVDAHNGCFWFAHAADVRSLILPTMTVSARYCGLPVLADAAGAVRICHYTACCSGF